MFAKNNLKLTKIMFVADDLQTFSDTWGTLSNVKFSTYHFNQFSVLTN